MQPNDRLSARNPAGKGYRYGTDRLVPPSETLERIRPTLSRIGLTRIANVTGLDVIGVPVVMSVRPRSRSLAVHQGKGVSLEAAKASAVMESLERWHAEHIDLPLQLASPSEIAADQSLDLDRYAPFNENREHGRSRRLLWLEGRDLAAGTPAWIPYSLVSMDFRADGFDPGGPDVIPPWMNSNGLASGNHMTEALVHALCELIERDAEMRTHSDPSARRRVDLATVDDPACLEVLEKYHRAGFKVAVWDITSSLGIPTFVCMIGEDPGHTLVPLGIHSGAGTHLRREIALLRALTEAAQQRLTFISGMRDDTPRNVYWEMRDKRTVASRWRILTSSPEPERHFGAVTTHQHDSFDDDIAKLLSVLHEAGMRQVAVVDLTKPDIAVPVVKVLVPGLLRPSVA